MELASEGRSESYNLIFVGGAKEWKIFSGDGCSPKTYHLIESLTGFWPDPRTENYLVQYLSESWSLFPIFRTRRQAGRLYRTWEHAHVPRRWITASPAHPLANLPMEFDSNTQPISWFNDRNNDGSLILKPPFQRKPIWAARQKCYLIESILLKLPIPEVYMQTVTSEDGKTTYAVVDGQQRIRTVLQFIGSERDIDQLDANKFALDKLLTTSPWRNYTFADLSPRRNGSFTDIVFLSVI